MDFHQQWGHGIHSIRQDWPRLYRGNTFRDDGDRCRGTARVGIDFAGGFDVADGLDERAAGRREGTAPWAESPSGLAGSPAGARLPPARGLAVAVLTEGAVPVDFRPAAWGGGSTQGLAAP